MKRWLLKEALWAVKVANDWYTAENGIEPHAHELAHAIIIGRGRIARTFDVGGMYEGHANRHELITVATEVEALNRLGYYIGPRRAAYLAYIGLSGYEGTIASVRRFLESYRPSERNVLCFINTVHHAAKVIGR